MNSSDAGLASSPPTTQEINDRRRSGRAVRKPDHFAEKHYEGSILTNGSAKRKRQPNGDASVGQEDDETQDPDSVDESEASADEDEVEGKRRRSRNKRIMTKPTSKRPRITNGIGTALAIRSANVPSKSTSQRDRVQKARSRQSQVNRKGLYAEVFGRGLSGEDAAARWFQRYEQHNIEGMCEMVNLVLQCTGCISQVTVHDIEDVDNVPNKLSDLQDEYREASLSDYPLISKLKDYAEFRTVLIDFFSAVIQTIHNSSSLYEDAPLWENLQTWVDTMSSAGIRPFRHTATLISLTMSTALCQVSHDLESSISMSRRQADTENNKKKVNRARVKSLQQKTEADETKLAAVESILKDEFDVVFVHRYRDVDPKIRIECVTAMGNWILTYRKMFLEGQYLRYLGWVLSDTVAQTRSEVVKQLKLLYKSPNNIGPLRGFTDRFRPRMVEIAARDAEPGIRADSIELLDRLRDAELLEPDDIDIIGQLIFDSEPRVRKAVAKFFVANIEDVYTVNVAPIGDEQLNLILPNARHSDGYLSPARSWIKFKCLAETMRAYDGDEEQSRYHRPSSMLVAANLDSRYMLATQAIFPHMHELQDWESLAGYLLYDHSSITSSADDADPAAAIAGMYKLSEGEEAILLEVLDYAVKLYLIQTVESQAEGKKKGRRTQASREDVQEKQEIAAHHLTVIIPQLLNKYGSVPQAASAILRLEHLLDMDLINELQDSEKTYSTLLDDINKQFMTHSDRAVLAEASVALLKAKTSEPAKEVADAKMQEMWDDTLNTLQTLLRNQNLQDRGTLRSNILTEVSNTVSRLSNLASISDCASILETLIPASSTTKRQKNQATSARPLDLLLAVCGRGVAGEDVDEDVAVVEDDLATSVIKTMLFYFMWKVQSLRTLVSTNSIRQLEHRSEPLVNLAARRDAFAEILSEVANSRLPLDPLRLLALSTTMDLYTLFSTLRHAKPTKESQHLPSSVRKNLDDLITDVPLTLQATAMQTHDRLEKQFAKKSHRKLEHTSQQSEPAEHDAPIGSDDEADEDAETTAADNGAVVESLGKGHVANKAAVLLAEQSLCEFTGKLVLANIATVIDPKHKERLVRNKLKLGSNYKEVLAYLEEPGEKKIRRPGGRKGAVQGKGREVMTQMERGDHGEQRKSEPMVLPEDDIQDEDMEVRKAREGHGEGNQDEEEIGGEQEEEEAAQQEEEEEGEEEGEEGNNSDGREAAQVEADEVDDVIGD